MNRLVLNGIAMALLMVFLALYNYKGPLYLTLVAPASLLLSFSSPLNLGLQRLGLMTGHKTCTPCDHLYQAEEEAQTVWSGCVRAIFSR